MADANTVSQQQCPVDRVPDDVLENVFQIAKSPSSPLIGGGESPWHACSETVSQVSRRWRRVALDLAVLWANLSFTLNEPLPLRKTQLWLQRSKACPLNITFIAFPIFLISKAPGSASDTSGMDDDSEEMIERLEDALEGLNGDLYYWCYYTTKIFELILPHVDRWRSFEMTILPLCNFEALICMAMSQLGKVQSPPRLESFRLIALGKDGGQTALSQFDPEELRDLYQVAIPFGGRMPALMELRLSGVHLNWSNLHPMQNLVHLKLSRHFTDTRPDYEEFSNMLKACPLLETLHLDSAGPWEDPEDGFPLWKEDVIVLAHLRRLVLANIGSFVAIELWRRISMPALKNLTLELDLSGSKYGRFVQFLCSNGADPHLPCGEGMIAPRDVLAQLEELSIVALDCKKTAMPRFFRHLSSIRTLFLSYVPYDTILPTLGKYLGPADGNGATDGSATFFCPLLEVVTLKAAMSEIGEDNLTNFLGARKLHGSLIQQFRIDVYDDEGFGDEGDTEADNAWILENVRPLVVELHVAGEDNHFRPDSHLEP